MMKKNERSDPRDQTHHRLLPETGYRRKIMDGGWLSKRNTRDRRSTEKEWKDVLLGEMGFALVAALMAIWILSAVGILVFTVSTQDLRISSRSVGEKMAFSAAETGLYLLTQNFNWQNLNANAVSNTKIDPTAGSQYTISVPTIPTSGPGFIPYPGFSMGGAEVWGRARYLASVTGTNTRYNSNVQVDSGIGYGPVDITTVYR
jgi:Tfp pilus assembly protein PilX